MGLDWDIIYQALAVIAFVGFFTWAHFSRKKDQHKFRAWAESKGYSFQAKAFWKPQQSGILPIDVGPQRAATNFVSFEGFRAFQCAYNVDGIEQKPSEYTVALKGRPNPGPLLRIQLEGLRHKAWDMVGGEDIDFESDAFSRMYWVECTDRKHAYEVINAEMMDFLLLNPVPQIQWGQHDLMVTMPGKIDAVKIHQMWNFLNSFENRIPRRLLAEKA